MATLYFDPADERPGNIVGAHELSTQGALFGALLSVSLHLSVPFMILLGSAVAEAVFSDSTSDDEPPILLEEDDVIEARFVQLGREFLPNEMPNRIVPRLSTAPPQPAEVPTIDTPRERAEPVERPDEPPPPDAVDDLLARLGDRAQAHAEIAEEREREGSAEGIEEGTETQATEGNLYRGRLYSFFRRGWSIPNTLSSDEAEGLVCVVDVTIGQELDIAEFSIRRASDSPVFDQSILEHLTRLQAQDSRVPPPPEEVSADYLGQTIALRFRGRDAH